MDMLSYGTLILHKVNIQDIDAFWSYMKTKELLENIINISNELTKLENNLFGLANDGISNELDREIWGEAIHGYPGGWTRPLSL